MNELFFAAAKNLFQKITQRIQNLGGDSDKPKLQVLNDGAFVVMGHLDEEKVVKYSNVECIYVQLLP